MKYLNAISLFLRIVFRGWEGKDCGIPDEYRMHYRLSPKVAWDIAWLVHK
jgi:hypothetical protein